MSFNASQSSYITLRNIISERTNKIIAWVGSGLSVPANLPTWAMLKKSLLHEFNSQIEMGEQDAKDRLLNVYQQIKETDNYWRSFLRLKDELGQTSYRAVIRETFRSADSVEVPDIYDRIWSLKISGLLNLNIDRLATRAYSANSKKNVTEFSANAIKSYLHVLQSPSPFIVNLHGRHDEFSSWIFTENELNWLLKDEPYLTFLKSCIATNVIMFIGISADDKAVGSHFEALSKFNIDTGNHFWITHRNDRATKQWAEDAGIRLILYNKGNDGKHSELNEIFDDLQNYLPIDDIASPVVSKSRFDVHNGELPPVEELSTYSSEKIRKLLNGAVSNILKNHTNENGVDYKSYDDFCSKYDEAIYRAWYTSTVKGKNDLFDHRLDKEVARGAFGRVYHAYDNQGSEVAVKVLLEEVRNYPESIQGFRRGIRSMKILDKNKITGMVGYREASEIPACVVMDWVEGTNLSDAVKAKQIDTWDYILKISSSLVEIIYSAHRLPERVLHRDLRPSNIMLKDFYTDPDEWEVMVLDFDLSWHRGSTEKSVSHGGFDPGSGYLAPEQLKKYHNVSTRHAAVDSFGLGMVLYYLLLQKSPMPFEHKHANYTKKILDKVLNKPCKQWRSIPARFASLILKCTQQKQSDRWDMGQIHDELKRLYSALLNPDSVQSTELITEELVARTEHATRYCWDQDTHSAHIELANALRITLIANESERSISTHFVWEGAAGYETKKIKRWLPSALTRSHSILEKASWQNVKKAM